MDKKPLITSEYARQNRLLHEQRAGYGANGGRYAEHVYGLMALWHPKTLIDYGCGKGGLEATVKELVNERRQKMPKISRAKGGRHKTFAVTMPEWIMYDPAIPGRDILPDLPADMLVCTDVLEHVEPEHIEETMTRLRLLTGKVALLTFALRESNKTLPDGRNTHLLVKDREWWADIVSRNFSYWCEVPWRNRDTFMVVAFR